MLPPTIPVWPEPVSDWDPVCQGPQHALPAPWVSPQGTAFSCLISEPGTGSWVLPHPLPALTPGLLDGTSAAQVPSSPSTALRPGLSTHCHQAGRLCHSCPLPPHPYLMRSVYSLGTWFLDLTDYTSRCPDPCPQGKHGLGVLGALFYCCHLGLDPCPIANACSDLWMPPAHLPVPEDWPLWHLWSSCPFLLMEILSLFLRLPWTHPTLPTWWPPCLLAYLSSALAPRAGLFPALSHPPPFALPDCASSSDVGDGSGKGVPRGGNNQVQRACHSRLTCEFRILTERTRSSSPL